MDERLEGWVDLDAFGVRLGFRVVPGPRLAGGPLQVEFGAELVGDRPVFLGVAGDRSRQRPAWFTFPSAYDGHALRDPRGGRPDFGGPATVAVLEPNAPFVQRLLLNEFVSLEDTMTAQGELVVHCRRPPYLGWTGDEALAARLDPVEVELRLHLRQDRPALDALVRSLVKDVWSGTPGERDLALGVLTSLRAPLAVALWAPLAEHPDPAVRERVQAGLADL